jgi:hypothetical protein
MSNEMFTQWNLRQQRHSRFHSCLPFEIDVNHSEAYFTGELSSMPAPLNSQDYSTGELVLRTPAFQPLPHFLDHSMLLLYHPTSFSPALELHLTHPPFC